MCSLSHGNRGAMRQTIHYLYKTIRQNSAKKVRSWVKLEVRIRKKISKLSFCESVLWVALHAMCVGLFWIFFPWIRILVVFRNLGLMLKQGATAFSYYFKWEGNNFLCSDRKHRINIFKRETEKKLIATFRKCFKIFTEDSISVKFHQILALLFMNFLFQCHSFSVLCRFRPQLNNWFGFFRCCHPHFV